MTGERPFSAQRDGEETSSAPSSRTEPPLTDDAWLDDFSYPTSGTAPSEPSLGARVKRGITAPATSVRRTWRFIATTPGTMVLVGLFLTIAIIAAGFSMSQSSADRQAGLNTLLTETEPLSYSAHNLYTNLSIADVVATTSFVRAGTDSPTSLERYFTAIDEATIAATQSASGIVADDARTAELVTSIQRHLPVYTAMVERARANAQSGNPLANTYMENASALMRDSILPAASQLFSITTNRVTAQQNRLTSAQWIPLSGLVAAAIFLILAQMWLWRKTRRRFNRGFLWATAMIITAIAWVSLSNLATWQAGALGYEEASRPWDSLTTARIDAQQTQITEMLALLHRESLGPTEKFDSMLASVETSLSDMETTVDSSLAALSRVDDDFELSRIDAEISSARDAAHQWEAAHYEFRAALESGDYDEALRVSTSSSQSGTEVSTSAAAVQLDRAFASLIDDARHAMRTFIAGGLAATALVATAVLLLSLGAVVAIWLGLRPRLQEYL